MSATTQIREAIARARAMEELDADLSREDIDSARRRAQLERRRALEEAPGVPIRVAADLLGLSEPTVRRLRDGGLIATQPGGSVRRLSLESLMSVRAQIERLREAGRQRGFVEALAQEAADRRLLRDPLVVSGLESLRRGEYTVVEE